MKLWHKIGVGTVLGIGAGAVLHADGAAHFAATISVIKALQIVGDAFSSLIKMVVVPLVFLSIVSGICGMKDVEEGRRVGLKAVFTFLAISVTAVIIGVICAEALRPGISSHVGNLAGVRTSALPLGTPISQANSIVDIVPSNMLAALSTNDRMLQVVLLATFVGFALRGAGELAAPLSILVRAAMAVIIRMVSLIMEVSPYAVFCIVTASVRTLGFDIIRGVGSLVATVALALALQYLLFGLVIFGVGRLSPLPFYRKMLGVQSFAFSIRSSKATMPTAMRALTERMGVSQTTASFVLPIGVSMGMAGAAAYLGICPVFVAQVYKLHLSGAQLGMLVLIATLGSIGAAGIPSGSIMMMGMIFSALGLPLNGIALILGVEPILDMFRSTINIMGDTAGTLLIDRSEGTFDEEAYLDRHL